MAVNMSIRLNRRDNGRNGHACNRPRENTYCIGQYSYPGELTDCGATCKDFPCHVACGLGVNAFGENSVTVKVPPPNVLEYQTTASELVLPPHTVCTWCYERKSGDEPAEKFDNNTRRTFSERYFEQFEPGKSLIFYYAANGNPFKDSEETRYTLVGVSRLKKISLMRVSSDADGIIWHRLITSEYPDEGFCIPDNVYEDNGDALNKIVEKSANRAPFKYGSREVSTDDAIEIISQLLAAVDDLIALGDKTQNWIARKIWLNEVIAELWQERGSYPGFPAVSEYLGLQNFIADYVKLTKPADVKNYVAKVRASAESQISDTDKLHFLFDVLTRFDLTVRQIGTIVDSRANVCVTATIAEMTKNPYVICEQYIDPDDSIPFYKIDNGVIPAPKCGIDNLLDVDSAERFRAFCTDELKKIPAHSFVSAESILTAVNRRIERLPAWKQHFFAMKNFAANKAVLDGALVQRFDGATPYLYLKETFEDERTIETALKNLANRADIRPKFAVSSDRFKISLKNPNSPLEKHCPQDYDKILNNQAALCMKIFNKPLCVISGKAGTGKTTIIRALLDTIEQAHGGTSFRLLAPTGKAAERIKVQTGKPASTISTIHYLLAKHRWLNKNLTFKRDGGDTAPGADTLIIDECSMIDLNLFATLIRAIDWNSVQRLILIGDPNQLPPIGRGKVFVDVINWLKKFFPDNIATLTDNVRQRVNQVMGNGCGILELAEVFIRENQSTDAATSKLNRYKIFGKIQRNGNVDKDLSVYFWQTQDILKKTLLRSIAQDLGAPDAEAARKLWFDVISKNPEKIQVITPYRGEIYGTEAINVFMQRAFKSFGLNKLLDGIGYSDKVIQIINRPQSNLAYAYDRNNRQAVRAEIYNGEIGLVGPHPFDLKTKPKRIEHFQVNFSGKTRQGFSYNYGKNLGKFIPEQKISDNLELAYAISVHKAQGSEFDYVYIVLPERDSDFLSMELLYTALTRAQKKVTLLLQNDISTLELLSRTDKSVVQKINSSVFEFVPLPELFI